MEKVEGPKSLGQCDRSIPDITWARPSSARKIFLSLRPANPSDRVKGQYEASTHLVKRWDSADIHAQLDNVWLECLPQAVARRRKRGERDVKVDLKPLGAV